jgi:hypothetical protein
VLAVGWARASEGDADSRPRCPPASRDRRPWAKRSAAAWQVWPYRPDTTRDSSPDLMSSTVAG